VFLSGQAGLSGSFFIQAGPACKLFQLAYRLFRLFKLLQAGRR
jgi:hypothetical protein